jgi:transcriptional regulator with XRE-family HTH domain
MNNSVNQRFAELMSLKAKSASEFSRLIGISQTTLSGQLSGSRGVSLDTIIATLSAFPDVSSQWLLFGIGSMFVTDNASRITGKENESELNLIAENAKLVAEVEEKDRKILILEDRCAWLKQYNEELLLRASSAPQPNYKKNIS